MISLDQKKEIRAANDIVDVVSGYIPVTPNGREYKAICPFHNDTRPSLQVSKQYQNFRCWSCDAKGDIFDFVMRMEKVEFGEALRMLAERGGIQLTNVATPEDEARGKLLRVMKWAEETYAKCLLNETLADSAREYLGTRQLAGATVRQFGLGFAPVAGDWLVKLAQRDRIPLDDLLSVGLIAEREEGRGYYDRFRDRVMFPIRDIRGRTVGFGGRILPSSPYASRGPKYYNSAETPLFHKSELIYGLDLARHPGAAAGYLAVVEGYTDVMMAHQCGVANIVATMGTALTTSHVLQLRRQVPKVVLVFDGDEAGELATDKALELFWAQNDIDIAITTLPDGLDPCELLLRGDGADVFRERLRSAKSVLEYKLDCLFQKIPQNNSGNVEQIVDRILAVVALAPSMPSAKHQLRQELAISRISHRLGLRQESVWARLMELKSNRRRRDVEQTPYSPPPSAPSPAPPREEQPVSVQQATLERQLVQLLLAEPGLVATAKQAIPAEIISHSGLRRIATEMYGCHAENITADLDALRVRLIDRPDLVSAAMAQLEIGRAMNEREERLQQIVNGFARLKTDAEKHRMKQTLSTGDTSDEATKELLSRLQKSI
jgi:DNA primase